MTGDTANADEERIDYSKFTLSLRRLEEQHRHLAQDIEDQPDWILEGVQESVIQRFETCFDTSWKLLRRFLVQELGLVEVPNSPKPTLNLAAENQLLGGEVEDWMEYNNARNSTSHDYDGKKAEACLQIIPRFICDAIKLHERLTGVSWRNTKP